MNDTINFTSSAATGASAQVGGATEFVKAVARYYRDFLETDFKKANVPTRQVRVRSREGTVLGFNVRRFPELHRAVLELLSKPLGPVATLKIRRNQYRSRITANLQTLVRAQVQAIPDQAFISAISEAVVRIKKAALTAQKDFDPFVDYAQDVVAEEVLKNVIRPIIKNIEAVLEHASLVTDDLVYEIEDDLREHVVAAIRENLPAALTALALHNDLKPLAGLLNDQLGPHGLRPFLEEFFAYLATADVYEELLAVAQVLAANESLELYLYVIDLLWQKQQFPVAYIPVRLQKDGDEFQLTLDSRLFFNRRALRYIPEHDQTRDLRIPGKPTDDRIHVVFDRAPRDVLEDAIIAMGDAYSIADRLRFDSADLQRVSAGGISLTSAMHFCAFDKSEESIINDYEEILLESGKPDSSLRELFESLVKSCILTEPASVRMDIEREWSGTASPDRLIYESPVPLNEEQRKLLLALRRPESRFNVVDGPPGTGKSHTITAIVFDAIQRGQSVLVLSDKQEALDVVEDKLTQALNEIRAGDNFPNPLLRLGRDSGTYGEILSRASVERIARYHVAAQTTQAKADEALSTKTTALKADVSKTSQALSAIKMDDIVACERLGAKFAGLELVAVEQLTSAVPVLRSFIDTWEALSPSQRQELEKLSNGCTDLAQFAAAISRRMVEAKLTARNGYLSQLLRQFSGKGLPDIEFLESAVAELRALRRPIIGYWFRGRELTALEYQFANRLPLEGVRRPHQRLRELTDGLAALRDLRVEFQQAGLPQAAMEAGYTALRRDPITSLLQSEIVDCLKAVEGMCRLSPEIAAAAGLVAEPLVVLNDWTTGRGDRIRELTRHIELRCRLNEQFSQVPRLDLQKAQVDLYQLHAARLANTLDDRFLRFATQKQALASSLKEVIRRKEPFPKDKFEALKDAFPCIIAGIREFADYIPLGRDLFDLVIIDEASQVSIAQALPALMRARQVVVMGDEKQFANVKTSQASRAVNSTYMSAIERAFRESFNPDAEQLARMRQFDVRTSILKFFELIANFRIMLRKHFRGYQEIISFSSRYFYGNELQAIRIRARPVNEVIRFSVIETNGGSRGPRNANSAEADYIHDQLQALLQLSEPPTVGVITPFTEQQRFLSRRLLFDTDFATDFRDRLNLKIMTFDTCQGEERDVVFYSMVASPDADKLNYVFPLDLHNLPEDADQKIKVQRLNVGFSRARDVIHFVLSQPVESFRGSAAQALRHYQQQLVEASRMPDVSQVDPSSPMEAQLLHWLKQTPFVQNNAERVEIRPQFHIGRYLKQLDPHYQHPRYRCDFLLLVQGGNGKTTPIILEYDGFREHFASVDDVTADNYEFYYREEDVERQQILESYGYNFIRVNRFNLGKDPVATLSARLSNLIEQRQGPAALNELTRITQTTIADIEAGNKKQCPKCARILPIEQFRRRGLKTGQGRTCNGCARAG